MSVRHSIIMICYNQEDYIRTALDSVLSERVKPHEIIIGDDYSTDGTRKILEEYRIKYPDIIELVLNEKNLGIFANFNNVASRATGDVISILAGDDWYKPKLLENMDKKIEELNINPATSRFILLPHVVFYHQDGSGKAQKNYADLLLNHSPVGSVLRGQLVTRHIGLSRALFEKWPLFESDAEEIGPWADLVHHVLLTQHVESMPVMDCEGPVYRVGVGIASKTGEKKIDRSYLAALLRIQDYYIKEKLNLSNVDAKYLEFLIQCWSARVSASATGVGRAFLSAWNLVRINWHETGPVGKELFRMSKKIVFNRLRLLKNVLLKTFQ